MVLKLSKTKIISRPVDPEDIPVPPEKTFVAIDACIETSKKDEFILGNLFDYDGNKINYIWDTKKNQVASLKSQYLSTEVILLATDFLKKTYIQQPKTIDAEVISNNILTHLKEITEEQRRTLPPQNEIRYKETPIISNRGTETESEAGDKDFIYNYEEDANTPVFDSEFLEDDEEVDDFDEQLAIKSQEFLKEHPELKSEMEIVRLLEGN